MSSISQLLRKCCCCCDGERDFSEKSVFISGCDSGFGYLLALRCLRGGWGAVFAGCLTDEGRDRLMAEAEREFGSPIKDRLHSIPLDIRDPESVERARATVEDLLLQGGGADGQPDDAAALAKGTKLNALVNNAGIAGVTGWDGLLLPDDYEEVWQVNTMGTIRLTHALKPMLKRARGRIISTTSILGRVALPCRGPYTVSKFALEGYCDTLRRELAYFGMHVSIVEPAWFTTPLLDPDAGAARQRRVLERASPELLEEYGERNFTQPRKTLLASLIGGASEKVELVVDAYYHALTAKRPKKRYAVGWLAKWLYAPGSCLPTPLEDALFSTVAILMGGVRGRQRTQD